MQGLRFHEIDNPQLICYSRATADRSELLLCVVNLDPHHEQSGWLNMPLTDFGLDAEHGYQLHDLLSEARYLWHGDCNFVTLNPEVCPAHIFRIRRKIRREQDFEYYL
jgi:starch synthase (maltosyl-transferring)